MRACPQCQRTYPDDTDFCPRDGSPLPPDSLHRVIPADAGIQIDANLAAGLSSRFRIVRPLGAGAMGTVFLAEQIAVGNRVVALKVLNRKLLDDPEFLLRFQNEAASTGRIHHPNVVTIYESGQADDGTPYIAMEFLEGESLRQALSRRGAPVKRGGKGRLGRVGSRSSCFGSAELFLSSAACILRTRRRGAGLQFNSTLPARHRDGIEGMRCIMVR
jgi:serine/threonine protein kinase